jgi:DNA repair protein RecO
LDLFYLANFSFRRSRTSELHHLQEVSVIETHAFLRRDLAYLQQASYCVRLIEQATETDTPIASFFEMFRGFLAALATQPCGPQMIFAFELRLLAELGLQPDISLTRLSEGTKALARSFKAFDWSASQCLRLDPSQQSELRQFLHAFLLHHLGRIPKGRDHALDSGREQ